MPMNRSPLIGNVVGYFNFNPIAPVRLYDWARELTIDQEASVLVKSIRVARLSVDGPSIMTSNAGIWGFLVEVGVLY